MPGGSRDPASRRRPRRGEAKTPGRAPARLRRAAGTIRKSNDSSGNTGSPFRSRTGPWRTRFIRSSWPAGRPLWPPHAGRRPRRPPPRSGNGRSGRSASFRIRRGRRQPAVRAGNRDRRFSNSRKDRSRPSYVGGAGADRRLSHDLLRPMIANIDFRPPGAPEAFELLLAHRGMIVGYLGSILHDPHLVEDAFQEVALVVLRKGGGLRHSREFPTWVRRIARLEALAALRRLNRRPRPFDHSVLDLLDAE